MKNNRLTYVRYAILVSFVVLGALIGSDLALMLYPLRGKVSSQSDYQTFGLLFFFVSLAAMLMIVLIAVLFFRRNSLLSEQASTKEYFQNEHFVYTEMVLTKRLKDKQKHKRLRGVLAALGVKDLNSEILSLYGPEVVREINEIIFNCIYGHFLNRHDYLYAYNVLDDFLIYKDTSDPAGFYAELNELSKEILQKLESVGSLPNAKLLIGAYEIRPYDTVEEIIRRAAFAEKFNSSTRLNDDVVVFTNEMVGQGEGQRDLSHELSRALDEGQFEIFYQPKFDLKNEKFFGAEALVRWNHPVRGLLPPSLFIPYAEQSGSIVDIDRYVFRHVCLDIAKWEKEGKRLLKISVNLSRRSIYDNAMLAYFKQTMDEFKVNPLLIEIELTESVAAKDTIFTAAMIKKIKMMGVSTAIDDFGVGYSSFSALKKIPFDVLKVDKTFIDDIEIDKKARDMVECVIRLGHSLDMSVIAEGVQTDKQVEILRKMGLDSIQGYYYSKPLPCFDYERLLENNAFEKRKVGA